MRSPAHRSALLLHDAPRRATVSRSADRIGGETWSVRQSRDRRARYCLLASDESDVLIATY
jgi:hypothetical protein